VILLALVSAALMGEDKPRYAGPTANGFLLPNGWTISPAGKHVPLKDLLPLNIAPVAGGKYVLVATSGYHQHELVLIDLRNNSVADRHTMHDSWFGLTLAPQADKLWWCGGGSGRLNPFDLKEGKLRPGRPVPDSSQWSVREQEAFGKQDHFNFTVSLALIARNSLAYNLLSVIASH
jgi:hypothetical protein